MRKIPGTIWRITKKAAFDWLDDRAPTMGAAIAFYTIFSLAPTLLLVTAVAALAFGDEAARGALVSEMRDLMGEDGASAVENMIESAAATGRGVLATIVGIGTLLVGATTVFAELQASLNTIFRAQPPKEPTIIWIVRVRLAGLSLIMVMGFLLLVALVISAAIAAVDDYLQGILPGFEVLLLIVNAAVSFGVVTTLFAITYRFLPDVQVSWDGIWVGAAVATLLFTVGKTLIGLYIGNTAVATTYGAAGALVIILLWVYFSAQIFLFGAEIAKAYNAVCGSGSAEAGSAAKKS